jgi:hypothetical protein
MAKCGQLCQQKGLLSYSAKATLYRKKVKTQSVALAIVRAKPRVNYLEIPHFA